MRDLRIEFLSAPEGPPSLRVLGLGGLVREARGRGATAVLVGRLSHRPAGPEPDAEVALRAFLARGIAGVERLEGDFALALHDERGGVLHLLRDPSGAYPLFYAPRPGGWAVAATADRAAGPGRALDFGALAEYLATPGGVRELPMTATAWRGTRRVRPGERVTLAPGHPPETRRWWDWPSRIDPDAARAEPREAARELRRRLDEAVRARVAGRRAAAHLSGGLDSSTVATLAAGHADRLSTVSLVYRGHALEGETAYIRATLDRYPRVRGILIDGGSAPDFEWFGPSGLPSHGEPHLGLYHVAAEAALVEAARGEGAEVLLTGGGADEFAEGPPSDLAQAFLRGRPDVALRAARAYARASLRSPWGVLRELGFAPLLPPRAAVPRWILPSFARDHDLHERARQAAATARRSFLAGGVDADAVDRAAGDWSAWNLAGPAGMAVAQPFLDARVLAWLLGLPPHVRRRPGVRKPLVVRAARGLLPECIRRRRDKVGFDDAYQAGLLRNLAGLEALVARSSGAGLFEPRQLLSDLAAYAAGIGDASVGAWLNAGLALLAWLELQAAGDAPREVAP